MSASDSVSASGTDATSASTSASGSDTDATGGDTDTTTGGGSGFCGDDPPKGYVGDFNAECKNEPQVGSFNPLIEWHKDKFMGPAGAESASAPIVVQISDDNMDGMINEDDMPDIVFISYGGNNGILRGVSGDGLTEHVNVGSVGLDRNKSIAAADIDGDGIVEILSSTTAKEVIAFEHDGTVKWKSVALTGHVANYEVAVAISDMNGDGTPELVAGRAILDNMGNVIGTGTHGIGAAPHANGSASMSFAVDVDDDGQQEVVVGNALYNIAGGDIWFNNLSDGYPAVADFDLDGTPEIVVVSNDIVRLQSSADGSVIWSVAIPGGIGGPPTVADFDGDTFPEIGVAGKSRYSVFNGDGTVLWTNVTQDASSGITGSSVYDFEGDGIADVVYADEINLYVYAGNDGTTKLKLTEHNSGTRLEYPVIADVDNDDQVEIVFVSEVYNGTYQGVTVVGDKDLSWRPGRKIWNQHAYHITNETDLHQNRPARPRARECALTDRSILALARPDFVLISWARWPSRSPTRASARSSPGRRRTRSRTPASPASWSASSRAARRCSSSATDREEGTSGSASASGATPSRSTRPAGRRWSSSPASRSDRARLSEMPRTRRPTTSRRPTSARSIPTIESRRSSPPARGEGARRGAHASL